MHLFDTLDNKIASNFVIDDTWICINWSFFQCSLTDASSADTESTEVQLTVALKAIVEFEDLFGSVEVVANQVTQLTCKAKNARPQGKFSWRIEIPGEAQPQYLTNSQNAKHDRQKNGVVTSTEVLQYLYLHVSFTHWGKIILFVHKFTWIWYLR